MSELKSLADLEQLQKTDANSPVADQDKPPQKQLDDADQAFLEAAKYVDRGEDIPDTLLEKTGAKPVSSDVAASGENGGPGDVASGDANKSGTGTGVDGKKTPARDETGKFVKAEENPPGDGETQPVKGEAESEFARKQRERKEKDQARLDKTWENANKRREELDAEKRQVEADKAEVARLKAEAQAPAVQKPKYTSAQLYDASLDFGSRANEVLKKYRETGDDRLLDEHDDFVKKANEANKAANLIYGEEQKFRQQELTRQRDEGWKKAIEAVLPDEPDLLDNGTPLAKEVISLLGQPIDPQNPKIQFLDYFKALPNGFKHAVQIGKWKLGHDRAAAAEEALGKERTERERLEKLTQISGGGTTSAPSAKTFDKMSKSEQDSYLFRQAQEWDKAHNY